MAWSDEARAAALAARQGKGGGSKDLGRVDSGGIWNMTQGGDGRVTATHEASGRSVSGSLGDVHEAIGKFGMEQTMRRLGLLPASDQQAASALGQSHPKSGLTGIHSASAISRGITKLRLAFHNSNG